MKGPSRVVSIAALCLFAGSAAAFASGGPDVATTAFTVAVSADKSSINAGETVNLSFTYRCASVAADCERPELDAELPHPLVVQTFTQRGGLLDSASQTSGGVRFTFRDPMPAGSSGVVTVSARSPYCADPADMPASVQVTGETDSQNAATTRVDSSPIALNGIADCADPLPQQLGKFGYSGGPGGKIWWRIEAESRPASYVIEDELPSGLILTDLGGGGDDVEFEAFCEGAWVAVPWGDLYSDPMPCPRTLIEGYSAFPSVSAVRIKIAANTAPTFWIATFTDPNTTPGAEITNCIGVIGTGETSCDVSSVLEAAALPDSYMSIIGSPSRTLGPPDDWMPTEPLVEDIDHVLGPYDVAFSARVRNTENSGGPLVDPVLLVELDAGVDFDPARNWFESYISVADWLTTEDDPRLQAGCSSPIMSKLPNFGGSGKTMLRWQFRDCVIPGGNGTSTGVAVYFSTSLQANLAPGSQVTATVYTTAFESGTQNPPWNCWDPQVDTDDMDGDLLDTDDVCRGDSVTYTVPARNELTSAAYVKGTIDAAFTRFPAFGDTNETGNATYEFSVTNTGNGAMDAVDLVDVLAHVGDTSTLPPYGAARIRVGPRACCRRCRRDWERHDIQLGSPRFVHDWIHGFHQSLPSRHRRCGSSAGVGRRVPERCDRDSTGGLCASQLGCNCGGCTRLRALLSPGREVSARPDAATAPAGPTQRRGSPRNRCVEQLRVLRTAEWFPGVRTVGRAPPIRRADDRPLDVGRGLRLCLGRR